MKKRSRAGIALHDLSVPTRSALQRAADLGFGSVEIGTTRGDTMPRQLSQSGRRQLVRLVSSHGMSVAALDAGHPRGLLARADEIDRRIGETKIVLELARDMRVSTVVAAMGGAGSEDLLAETLHELGQQADRIGIVLAVQTGGVATETLIAALNRLNCPALRVCLDPGALIMNGCDPVEVAGTLAGHIALSYLRDATAGGAGASGYETALGEGHLDLMAYSAALDAAGYHGDQVIRRSDPIRAAAELAQAKSRFDALSSE